MASIINAATSGGLISTADTSGILQLQTASTAAVTVDASQNVGIGTASPTASSSHKTLTLNAPATFGSLIDFKTNETLNLRFFVNGTNSVISTKTATPLVFETNDIERMRILSSGEVGIGTTAPARNLAVSGGASEGVVQITNTTSGVSGGNGFELIHFTNGQTQLINRRNNLMSFYSNNTERMVLPAAGGVQAVTTISVGNATPSASGAGITFPATQSASSDANTLDDYEEGTWTPTVTFGGASVGITYNTTFTGATYTKIGNRVCISGFLLLTNKGSSTGSARIANLPFTSESGNTKYLGATVGGSAFTFANQFWAFIDPNTNLINIHESTEAGASSSLTNSDLTNGTEFYFSATYTV